MIKMEFSKKKNNQSIKANINDLYKDVKKE